MKATLVLLCILPLVLCASLEERGILDKIPGLDAFDLDTLKCDLQIMLDVLGSDPAEMACEDECHKVLQQGHILNYGCKPVCIGFKNLIHKFHIVDDTKDPAASKCHRPMSPTTTAASGN